MPRISPTVGRNVHYTPSGTEQTLSHIPLVPFALHGEGPYAAIVTAVHSDTMVNLTVFDGNGATHGRTSVPFIPDDTPPVPDGGAYATWMPYQLGQAAQQQAQQPAPNTTPAPTADAGQALDPGTPTTEPTAAGTAPAPSQPA